MSRRLNKISEDVPAFTPMRVTEEMRPEARHRKNQRELLACDVCGQPSRLSKGLCPECVVRYHPTDLEDLV